jgi:hypothetical protein
MRCALAATFALAPLLAFAQAPPEPVFAALEKKLEVLEQKYPGVKFDVPRAEVMDGWARMNYKPIQSEANANAYVDLFIEEFTKYPVDFIKACKLKRVEIVDKLAIGTQFRAAVPNYKDEVLLYDVSYVHNERYVRHVVHHEFYHMLEEEWNGDPYYRDPNWAIMNEKDFKYGTGGADAYGRGDVWSFVHPKPGFLNVYSTYGLEEDKAEIWAVLFVPENWKLVKPLVADDAILRGKVGYMREFGRGKSSAMNDAFWKRVSGD